MSEHFGQGEFFRGWFDYSRAWLIDNVMGFANI